MLGKTIWYWPKMHEFTHTPGKPLVAIVCSVPSEGVANVAVFDANGNPFGRTFVPVYSGQGQRPEPPYCELTSVRPI